MSGSPPLRHRSGLPFGGPWFGPVRADKTKTGVKPISQYNHTFHRKKSNCGARTAGLDSTAQGNPHHTHKRISVKSVTCCGQGRLVTPFPQTQTQKLTTLYYACGGIFAVLKSSLAFGHSSHCQGDLTAVARFTKRSLTWKKIGRIPLETKICTGYGSMDNASFHRTECVRAVITVRGLQALTSRFRATRSY